MTELSNTPMSNTAHYMRVTTWERPAKPKPQPSAEALEPAMQILGCLIARWKYASENDTYWFADHDCIADDLSWGADIVADYTDDLIYDGFAVELPDGQFVPTAKGAKHHASIG